MSRMKELESVVNAMSITAFGEPGYTESLRKRSCVMCKKPVTQFKDDLSIKEYAMSGLCQTCQDGYFDS
jgi:hypothetical protein|tara:strand:+ start:768 stop:974 length:207 start_codon:yes stop_codon:yes gene_type:complete